jgi:hypothetical protein
MQVESSGGSTKVGGSTTADDTPAYPTPLPICVPVSVFQDDNSNPLDVLAVNCHTAILGKSGGGKTHLACHLDRAVGTDQGVEPRVGCRHHATAGTNRPHAAHHATQSQPPCRSSRHVSPNPHVAQRHTARTPPPRTHTLQMWENNPLYLKLEVARPNAGHLYR